MSDENAPPAPEITRTSTGEAWPQIFRPRDAGHPVTPGPEDDAPDDAPDDEDDEDEAYEPPSRRGRAVGVTLVALTGLSLAFTGGVLVQKRHDAGLTAAAGTGLPAGLPSGLPGGLQGGFPGGLAGGSPGTPGAGGSAAAGPVLVGTVVSRSGGDVTVKDFQGRTYTVRSTGSTTVTTQRPATVAGLATGTAVSIEGTKQGSTVTATSITARP